MLLTAPNGAISPIIGGAIGSIRIGISNGPFPMNEAETRAEHIDSALKAAG